MSEDRTHWDEIVYLAHQLGYSLVKDSENFIGNLKVSQIHEVFSGWSKHEKKKADSMKRAGRSGGGRKMAGMGDLSRIPGVKVGKRKRKK